MISFAEYPNEKAARNLTLIAKTLQTLANFTRFQGKENFMEFMNDFLEREAPNMKEFLRNISVIFYLISICKLLIIIIVINFLQTRTSDFESKQSLKRRESCPSSQQEFDGYIDLGKQLSILSTLLKECIAKVSPAKLHELKPLEDVLETLHKNYCKQRIGQVCTPPPIRREDNIFVYNDPTANVARTTTIPNQEQESNGTMELRRQAATLPRNNTFGNPTSEDFLVEPAPTAFVSKSPTPKAAARKNGTYANQIERRGPADDNNVPNLDDISDLLNYADEPEDAPNGKGSNMSISQLSNVASSGYQSFAYSQSSSPVDLTINGNVTNAIRYGQDGRCLHVVNGNNNNNGSRLSRKAIPTPRTYTPSNGARNQALAFANPVYSMEYSPKTRLETSSSDEERAEHKQIVQVETARPNIVLPRTNPSLAPYRGNQNQNCRQYIPDSSYQAHMRLESGSRANSNNRDKHLRRLSLESGRDLSDSSSEAEETMIYHTTGRHRKTHRGVEHYERQIERLQASVDVLRQKLELADLSAPAQEISEPEGDTKMRAIIDRLEFEMIKYIVEIIPNVFFLTD